MIDETWNDARWRSRVRASLKKWFATHARVLPWRTDPTPYRVWVSEIMLQQTQVATVLPYFDRFMRSFPTIESLAQADEQSLMRHWEGLGYYRRARSLHAAAKRIVDEHGGEFPQTFDEVVALPGIGRYTAGAILSIACDQPLPILEGNTVRVFSRWIALRTPVKETASNKLLWQVAEAMVPRSAPSTFNQAAMELGALICTPTTPQCDRCPVAKHCAAHTLGLEKEIPGKVTKIAYENRREFAFVVVKSVKARKKRYLLRPLPEGSRWAGLWDFPRTFERSLDSVEAAATELTTSIGSTIRTGQRLTTIKHAVTKYRITLNVYAGDFADSDSDPSPPWQFVSLEEMESLPMSVTGRRIAKLLASDHDAIGISIGQRLTR